MMEKTGTIFAKTAQKNRGNAPQKTTALSSGYVKLLGRLPGTHRYQVTAEGLRICLFLTKVHIRVIRPGFSQLMDGCPNSPHRPVATAMRQLDRSLDQLIAQAKLAA